MKTTKRTVNAAAESKTAAVSTTASVPANAAAKPAAEKKSASKTTKPAAEKKTAVRAAKPAAEKKSASKMTKAAAEKKPAAAKAPAKRPGRKPVVTIDSICNKVEKKISKTKAAAVKEKIAVDIEVWGFEDGSKKMYIEINNGKAVVSPHTYDAKDFRVSLSVANAAAFVDGKITLKALLEEIDFYAEGNIAKAVKLASIF